MFRIIFVVTAVMGIALPPSEAAPKAPDGDLDIDWTEASMEEIAVGKYRFPAPDDWTNDQRRSDGRMEEDTEVDIHPEPRWRPSIREYRCAPHGYCSRNCPTGVYRYRKCLNGNPCCTRRGWH